MDIAHALTWATGRRNGTLITLRRDGRAQSSDIAYAVMGDTIKISVTGDRAKTRNIARDGRVILHISEPSSYSYLSIDATAELSDITTDAGDAAADELVEVYRAIAGEHDDWDDYRRAMVDEGRCVIRLTPQSVTGMTN
ncbi:MAG: PPOX class F420-dependent oxidoreductase [Actinomycetota bacterium]